MQFTVCYFGFDRTRLTSGPHYEHVHAANAVDARGKFCQRHPSRQLHIAAVFERETEDPDNPETWGGDPKDWRHLGV